MGDLLSKPKPIEDVMKENKRAINRGIRDLEREVKKMENNEKKLTADIKKMAKRSQTGPVKVMLKDLIQTRSYIDRFIMLKTQLSAVGLKMQSMQSHQALTNAMKGAFGCMKRMNDQCSIPELQNIMKQFAIENEKGEMNHEMMEDMIDDTMGAEDSEVQVDAMYEQVIAELGLDMAEYLPEAVNAAVPSAEPSKAATELPAAAGGAPTNNGKSPDDDQGDNGGGGGAAAAAGGGGAEPSIEEVQARLNNLRR